MILFVEGIFSIFVLCMIGVLVRALLSASSGYDTNLKAALTPKYIYQRKQFFMTKRESDCYKALVQAVGNDYFIFPQAHLTTFLDEKIRYENWRAARAHIDRKSVDFMLCNKESVSPRLAIELDDWSHQRADRKVRDMEVERILQQVGMPLLRIMDSENLAAKIVAKIAEK